MPSLGQTPDTQVVIVARNSLLAKVKAGGGGVRGQTSLVT